MMTRRLSRSLSLPAAGVALVASLTLAASGAHAAELVALDPVHDTERSGLDIVSATIDNADYSVAVDVSFARHRSGNTIVGLQARGRSLVRLVNSHGAHGRDRSMLLDADGRVACSGLTSAWQVRAARLSFAVPSTCLWQGNYGALRSWVLTEPRHSGEDIDFLPQSTWVARG